MLADIGGGAGALAGEIAKTYGVEAFVIDPHLRIPSNAILNENRFIKANAERMPEIPDDTFHYIIGYNTMTYTDISKSVPEIYRILKTGGIADLDWEFPKKDQWAKLRKNDISRYVTIKEGMMTTAIHIEK